MMRKKKYSIRCGREKVHCILYTPSTDGQFPLVIHCNGMPGFPPEKDEIRFAKDFVNKSYAFFSFDYQGVRKSTGFFDFYNSHLNINTIITELLHLPEIDPSRIALFGESFGGAMAISHAARDTRIKCLVLRSPVFDTEVIPKTIAFEDLTKIWVRNEQMRFPVIDLNKEFETQTMHYNPKKLIKNIKCPICFVVGDNDEILPIAGFKELYSEVSNEIKKELHVIEKANHNFTRTEHLEDMNRIFLTFLETNLKIKSIEMINL